MDSRKEDTNRLNKYLELFRQHSSSIEIYLILNREGSELKNSVNEKVKLHYRALSEHKSADLIDRFRSAVGKVRVFDGDLAFAKALLNGEITRQPQSNVMVYQAGTSGGGPAHRALIPTLCNQYDIHVMNTDATSRALVWHKYFGAEILRAAGVAVPETWIYSLDYGWHMDRRPPGGLKVICKSTYEAYAVGVDEESVFTFDSSSEVQLRKKAIELGQEITVQEFIPGREIYVPILGTNPPLMLPPQILKLRGKAVSKDDYLKFEDNLDPKSLSFESSISLQNELVCELRKSSVRAFNALRLKGLSRLDYRLTQEGKFYLFDQAEVPSLSRNHAFNSSFLEAGYEESLLIPSIVGINLNEILSQKL